MPWLSVLISGLINQMPEKARGVALAVVFSLLIFGPGIGLFGIAQLLQAWGMDNIPACTIGLIVGEILAMAVTIVLILLIRSGRASRQRDSAKP